MEKNIKTASQSVSLNHSKLYILTIFGVLRVTAYFFLGSLGASFIIKTYISNPTTAIKIVILLSGFLFSWILIFLDYWFILRKMSVTKKT